MLAADFATMRQALYEWVRDELTGFTVSWRKQADSAQGVPAPPFPFASIEVISGPTREGRPQVTTQDTGADVDEHIEHDATLTLSVQLHSRDDVMGVASALETALFASDSREKFQGAGLSLVTTDGPRNLDEIAGASWERRAVLDVIFRARARVTRTGVGYIDFDPNDQATVPINGTVTQ